MRKLIYLFLTIVMVVSTGIISCANDEAKNMSQTGLIDQNGNIVSGTLIKTNTIWITNNVEKWTTNGVHRITTNDDGSIKVEFQTNIFYPNLPENATDLYRIYVPFAGSGDGYYTVDYRDYNRLKQLWFDQINRKGSSDGKVFAIRNKVNNRPYFEFQKKLTLTSAKIGEYSAQDYYYFNGNGDIVYKEDGKIIKKFMGAIITEYRDVEKEFPEKRWSLGAGKTVQSTAIKKYTWKQRGVYTVGAIYANTMTTEEARWKYLGRTLTDQDTLGQLGGKGDNLFKDGVFDFIAYRYVQETYGGAFSWAGNLWERQYITPGFIEVLVMYPYENMGYKDAAAVHSYYAYHGIYNHYTEYKNHPGIYFTTENMPYMTDANIYLAERPEYTTPLLNHSATFTDVNRGWNYLFMAGDKN